MMGCRSRMWPSSAASATFAYAEVGCDLLVYPRDQDRSTIAYTVELVEVSYREVVGFRAP